MSGHTKVLLLELNEITWNVVDRLIASHGDAYLPNFARLRREGAWTRQIAEEQPPHLDPWITWVTLHTGVRREVHGAAVLEQDSGSISAPRLWDYATEGGRSVGIFGSVSAYPPRQVPGFMVPGPFAPGNETYPKALEPIQAINRLGTSMHNRTGSGGGAMAAARSGLKVLGMGLRPATLFGAASQLLRERLAPASRWRRVSLQPRINFDVFSKLYRDTRPDFATFHSNHAAHYMHHYWRAWDDTGFTARSSQQEREKYGDAVPYGYRLCDTLIGEAMDLLDASTVLIVASSMGQRPYVNDRYQEGKVIVRIRDIGKLLDIIGRDGIVESVPTMVPQWNLRIPDAARRSEVRQRLEDARRNVKGVEEPAIHVEETAEILTVTPLGLSEAGKDISYTFPAAGGSHVRYALEDLFIIDAPTVKQGMHDREGLLAFFGAGIAKGHVMEACSNLDVAPTVLTLLDLPVPAQMTGRVLSEAWDGPAAQGERAPRLQSA